MCQFVVSCFLGSIFEQSKKKKEINMTIRGSKKEEQTAEPEKEANATLNEQSEECGCEDQAGDKDTIKEKSHKDQHKSKKDKNLEKIMELEATIAGIKDKHLRLQAEFDNFRKRTLKEKTDLIKSAGEIVLIRILPVIDDFDRALTSMKEVPDDDPAKIGFLLIYNKFRNFLSDNNVREIESAGADFNVDHHHALSKVPAPSEEMKGKIVDVIEKGYLLNDRVLRFAKVIIGE
jgi:molecular chaperone GrpE